MDILLDRFRNLLPQQIRFSAVKAVDRLADKSKERIYSEMMRVFDRPTPWTLRAMRVSKPSMTNISAEVGFRDTWNKRAVDYLLPEVYGGERKVKAFELLIQSRVTTNNLRGGRGQYPKGTTFVPGPGATIDRYGNMSPGQIQQIISGLGAQTDKWANTTRASKARKKRTGHYIATPKTIWFADKGMMTPLLIATKARPAYSKRFPFHQVIQRFIDDQFPIEFEKALSERKEKA